MQVVVLLWWRISASLAVKILMKIWHLLELKKEKILRESVEES